MADFFDGLTDKPHRFLIPCPSAAFGHNKSLLVVRPGAQSISVRAGPACKQKRVFDDTIIGSFNAAINWLYDRSMCSQLFANLPRFRFHLLENDAR